MANLFKELTIRSVTLRNRIGVSPMCQYWSNDGMASDWHLVHLGSRAVGGAGLIMCEGTAIEPQGRITTSDAGIWSDAHIDPLKRITKFILEYGGVPGIQLAHAGRKASCAPPWLLRDDKKGYFLSKDEGGWQTVAPSEVKYREIDGVPHELTIEEIKEITECFRQATIRCVKAGYKWLELHFAHGYLAHEFLSPLINKRTDKYGGSFENRTRLPLEIVRVCKKEWPQDLPFAVRISCDDWYPEGWDIKQSIQFCKLLKLEGVDLIDCSSGGAHVDAKIKLEPGYQVKFAEAIRKEVDILTAAVGLITDAKQAEEILATGKADIIFLARQFLRDAYWPLHAAIELGVHGVVTAPTPMAYVLRVPSSKNLYEEQNKKPIDKS